jgi:hypothetical protein
MKIRGSYDTEIDVTRGGYVRIEQPDPMGGDNSVVLFTADQLPALIRELQALLDDRDSWDFDETESDGMGTADKRESSPQNQQ